MGALATARTLRAKVKARGPKVVSLRCSHCGDPVSEAQLAHCDDCLFVYCQAHHGADLHLCAVVCAECPKEEYA